jgi:hypothetical protein
MNSQQVRNLQEAYLGVYNDLDEERAEGVKPYEPRNRNPLPAAKSLSGKKRDPEEPGYGKPRPDGKDPLKTNNADYKRFGEGLPPKPRPFGRPFGKYDPDTIKLNDILKKLPKGKNRDIIRHTNINASYDLYDIILSHLLDEGYAETVEAAESIMVNMSEDWRESICEANRGDEYATRGMSPEAANTWKSERRNKTRGFSSDVEQQRKNDERYKEKYGKYPDPEPNHMGGSQRKRQADTNYNRGKRTTLVQTTNDTLSPSGIRGTVTKPEIRIGTPLGGTKNPEPKGKYLHRQQMKDAQSSDPTKRSRAPQNSLYHMN